MEVHFICHIVLISDVITNDDCDNIINSCLESNSMLSDKEIIDFRKKAIIQFRQFIERPKEEVYNELIKQAKTWDNYALSIIYIHIFQNLFPSEHGTSMLQTKMKDLLMRNISPNYSERYSPIETRDKFKEIIQSKTQISSYTRLVDDMTPDKASKILERETRHLASMRN